MMSVTQLAQFLLSLDPPKNLARLAFYHYVKNWLEPQSALNLQHVDDFFDRCLSFDYWQSNRQLLGDTVVQDLAAFYKNQTPPFDLAQLSLPLKRQTIFIEHAEDFHALIKQWGDSKKQMGDQIRVLSVGENQLMLLHLLGMGGP